MLPQQGEAVEGATGGDDDARDFVGEDHVGGRNAGRGEGGFKGLANGREHLSFELVGTLGV